MKCHFISKNRKNPGDYFFQSVCVLILYDCKKNDSCHYRLFFSLERVKHFLVTHHAQTCFILITLSFTWFQHMTQAHRCECVWICVCLCLFVCVCMCGMLPLSLCCILCQYVLHLMVFPHLKVPTNFQVFVTLY